jgi:hypothetical protein
MKSRMQSIVIPSHGNLNRKYMIHHGSQQEKQQSIKWTLINKNGKNKE